MISQRFFDYMNLLAESSKYPMKTFIYKYQLSIGCCAYSKLKCIRKGVQIMLLNPETITNLSVLTYPGYSFVSQLAEVRETLHWSL